MLSAFRPLFARRLVPSHRPILARLHSTRPYNFSFDQPVSQYKEVDPPIALPPSKRLIIVTCMDARIDPLTQLGLKEGEAHIIRNAGGFARDALRSIVISQRLLGTREIAVFHHTGCSMVGFNPDALRDLVKDSEPGHTPIDFLQFSSDLKTSVLDDIEFLKTSPWILENTRLSGYIYDVESRESTRVV